MYDVPLEESYGMSPRINGTCGETARWLRCGGVPLCRVWVGGAYDTFAGSVS